MGELWMTGGGEELHGGIEQAAHGMVVTFLGLRSDWSQAPSGLPKGYAAFQPSGRRLSVLRRMAGPGAA